ncbi:MAG: hypothetical protein MUP67_10435, partial [Acidimicrobiia bacterium]|nr:hypothetical protein [Acidimicrobiia bacterium]
MTKFRRRVVSIPGVILGALLLLVLLPIWLPITLIVDLVTAPRRLPRIRLVLFALCWAWLESVALGAAFAVWATRRPLKSWYTLQRWWAARIVGALRVTCGFRMDVEGAGLTLPGPVIVFARHASLADSVA